MVVHPSSNRIPRVRPYSGSCSLPQNFIYGTFTLFGLPSHAILLSLSSLLAVLTPIVLLHSVWPLSLSLAATQKISFDFSSSAYLDVSVQRVSPCMTILFTIQCQSIALTGSPIRKSADQQIFALPRSLSQLVTSFFGS